MTWPSVDAPATAPSDHGEVRTQAYYGGGGDYFRSGYYSHGLFTSAAMTTLAITLNRLYLRPFAVPVRRAFDRIGVTVTTAATAASGGVVRLGLYDSAAGLPNAQLAASTGISTESTGAKEFTISLSLDPGIYWVACVSQVSSSTLACYSANHLSPWQFVDATLPPTTTAANTLYQASIPGALPSSITSGSLVLSNQAIPATSLRAA